jgi:hypothetical protein
MKQRHPRKRQRQRLPQQKQTLHRNRTKKRTNQKHYDQKRPD